MIELTESCQRFGVSLSYIIVTALAMSAARIIQAKVFSHSPTKRGIALEFIATFELLATAFELGIVLGTHGFVAYGALLILLLNYWMIVWPPAMTSPHPHIADILFNGSTGRRGHVEKILAQISASAVVYLLYVKPFWSLGYRAEHLRKVANPECSSLLNVPMIEGMLFEAGATFWFMMASNLLGKQKVGRQAVVPVIFVIIKWLGLSLTGSFMNPILATTVQFACKGVEFKEHLWVYWMGPLIGLLSFKFVTELFGSDMKRRPAPPPVDKKKKKK